MNAEHCMCIALFSYSSAVLCFCLCSQTGANKGLGYLVVSMLARSDPHLTVLLGSRNAANGAASVAALNQPNVRALEIDVTRSDSVDAAVREVTNTYGGLDILCNNAGVFDKPKDNSGDVTTFDNTLPTNYFGLVETNEKFLPVLKPNGRIVNVASELGVAALKNMAPDLRNKFLEPNITVKEVGHKETAEECICMRRVLLIRVAFLVPFSSSPPQVTSLVHSFRDSCVRGTAKADGWAPSAYGVSKAAVINYTRALAKTVEKGITVAAVCPGWCRTDMGSQNASQEQRSRDTRRYAREVKKR